MVGLLQKYKDKGNLPNCVIHCFCGTVEQANKYLSMGCYIGLTGKIAVHIWSIAITGRFIYTSTYNYVNVCLSIGYLWKDKSEDGVRKILQDNVIPLDRLLVETDAPFMYPNTRASKLPQNVKDALTER